MTLLRAQSALLPHDEAPQQPWRRLLSALSPHRWRIAAGFVGLILSSAVGLAFPLLIGQEIGQVLAQRDYARLDAFALLLLGLFAIMAAGGFLQTYFLGAVGERVVFDLRTRLFQ